MAQKNTGARPVQIQNDSPVLDHPILGFDAYADTLAELIVHKENATPMNLMIYGEWGAGKTTLLKALKARLDSDDLSDPNYFRRCKTVWFQAWKYDHEKEILPALIEAIFKAMAADGFFTLARTQIDMLAKRIDKSKVFSSISSLVSGVDISEFFADLHDKERIGFFDTFQKFFDDLIWTFLNWRYKFTAQDKPGEKDDKKGALVVLIDDLDRCRQACIVNLLETIKINLERAGCIFVMATTPRRMENALIAVRSYRVEEARHFVEKMIQVGFTLPQNLQSDFKPLIDKDSAPVVETYLPQILPAVAYNPRRFKNFINKMNLLNGLLTRSNISPGLDNVFLWGVVALVYPDLADDIRDNPDNLFALQKQIKRLKARVHDAALWQLNARELMAENVPHSFLRYLMQPYLSDVVGGLAITSEVLPRLLMLYESVDPDPLDSRSKTGVASGRLVGSDWVMIPSGPFISGVDKKTVMIDAPFEMAVYPVTNAQYRDFIEDGGYQNPAVWSQAGWQWRQASGIAKPRFWDVPTWNSQSHPVVGVSWYEAEAFACWAGNALPTQQQWERAAGGEDGWCYPWGNDFDMTRCNTDVSAIARTTRVDRYPRGISRAGCYDMTGNVWEWTANEAGQTSGKMVLKGGCWAGTADNAQCVSQIRLAPHLREPYIGFRCIRKPI